MNKQILISPPAAGKTAACIQMLRDLFARKPTAKAWVIVRDRLQASHFRDRLAAGGGSVNVRVETFRDLNLEVLERSGVPIRPQVSPAMQYRIVQAAIAQTDLHYFSPLSGLPGLTHMMQSLIAEAERALVSPADILAQAASDRPGHTELAHIYQSYLLLLDTIGWMSPEELAELALRALKASPQLMADWDLLVVDGFDWFEPAQLKMLQALSCQPLSLIITLPGAPHSERPVHRRFTQSFSQLSQLCDLQVLPTLSQVHGPAPLAVLEAQCFQSSNSAFTGPAPEISLIEARSPAEEAREALRWIKSRILRDGIRPSKCAVLVPDPDLYYPALRSAAAEFGLPIRFTQGRRLIDSPMISAMLKLLSLPANNFPCRLLLGTLRSPFFDFSPFGLEHRQIDVLDLISRQSKVIEGLDQWQEVFAGLESQSEDAPIEQPDEEEGLRMPSLPRGSSARLLWHALKQSLEVITPPNQPQPLHDWIIWLETCLSKLGFYEAGCSQQDLKAAAALKALRDSLQDLLTADNVLYGMPAQLPAQAMEDYQSFYSILQSSLESISFQEEDAGRDRSIVVMRPLEARGVRYDSVAVLGLAEGIFPFVERPDPLLDEAMRQRLGLNPRLEKGQLSDFYQAVTRADGALLLTRPYLAESGDPWEASPYWNEVKAIFPHRVTLIRPEDLRPLAEAASPQETLFWAARHSILAEAQLPEAYRSLSGDYAQVLSANQRLDRLLGAAVIQGNDGALKSLVQRELAAKPTWSVSRLEMYLGCPNRYFLESFLGLEAHEPPDWDYDPAQLGSLLHAILDQAYSRADNPAEPESVLAVLPQVAEAIFEDAPDKFGFRPSRLWDLQRDELLERVKETVVGLAELQGNWRPLRFEQSFGFDGAPPLILDLDHRQVYLHGYIDRIDVNEAGELRVIDYKTGSSHLSMRDLVDGRRLQLAVYALAARDALDLGEPVEGFYWHIGQNGRSALRLANFKHAAFCGPQGAFAIVTEHIDHAVNSLYEADFRPLPMDGKCSAYCAVSSWCWHYQPE